MTSRTLRTPIDDMLDLLKEEKQEKISSKQLSERLKVPLEVLDRWAIILEERGVIKVKHSRFSSEILYQRKTHRKSLDLTEIKQSFINKCYGRELDFNTIRQLWASYVKNNKQRFRKEFVEEGKAKGYVLKKIDRAWLKFEKDLEEL